MDCACLLNILFVINVGGMFEGTEGKPTNNVPVTLPTVVTTKRTASWSRMSAAVATTARATTGGSTVISSVIPSTESTMNSTNSSTPAPSSTVVFSTITTHNSTMLPSTVPSTGTSFITKVLSTVTQATRTRLTSKMATVKPYTQALSPPSNSTNFPVWVIVLIIVIIVFFILIVHIVLCVRYEKGVFHTCREKCCPHCCTEKKGDGVHIIDPDCPVSYGALME